MWLASVTGKGAGGTFIACSLQPSISIQFHLGQERETFSQLITTCQHWSRILVSLLNTIIAPNIALNVYYNDSHLLGLLPLSVDLETQLLWIKFNMAQNITEKMRPYNATSFGDIVKQQQQKSKHHRYLCFLNRNTTVYLNQPIKQIDKYTHTHIHTHTHTHFG